MPITNCYLCKSTNFLKRQGVVRDNPDLNVLECTECKLVFLSDFNHINSSHYENSGMHGDTLISIPEWLKDTESDDERRFQFIKIKAINKILLDFGCGVGGFLLKSKNITKLSVGIEPEMRLQNFYKSQNLTVYKNLEELQKQKIKFDIITAFHVMEHLPDPILTLTHIKTSLKEDGEIILEVPNSDDALLTLYNSKEFSNFTYWSQHLYLFNQFNLSKLINKAGLKVNWIRQVQRYSIANHLYWLSFGKPGGHKVWAFLDNQEIISAYENNLASLGICDTLIASASI
jgi:2-polyprenyl-3-methyl-5-hydroxy-6-metoxy-1,4-benzoquinol methylase